MKKFPLTIRWALAALAMQFLTSGPAHAQLLTKFGPVNGVLVGTVGNPQTVAATSANILGLWSGSCSGTTFLNGAGACATPAGTAPSGTTNLVYATPNGSTGAATLRALVVADLPAGITVAKGGTGAATLTGLLKGNGTAAFTPAASADVISLWSGTCSSTTYLRGDGTCNSPGGAGTVTSVTAGTGLTSSPNPIISSGTVSIDFTAADTWTGNHLWQQSTSAVITPVIVQNQSTGTAAQTQLRASNSTNAGNFGITGTGFTGSPFTGADAPAGEQVYVSTSSTDPLVFATNGIYRGQIGPTGVWTIGSTATNAAIGVHTSELTVDNTATNFNPLSNCANGQASGQRCWVWRIGGAGDMSFSPGDDAGSPQTSHSAFDVVRGAGFVISEIDLSNTTDQAAIFGGGVPLNGNLTWTALYVGNSGVSLASRVAVSGYMACADLPGSAVATSTATTFSVGTLPTAARPAHAQTVNFAPTAEDNGTIAGFTFSGVVNTSGTVTFLKNNSSTGWTATGQKGVTTDTTFCYFLN